MTLSGLHKYLGENVVIKLGNTDYPLNEINVDLGHVSVPAPLVLIPGLFESYKSRNKTINFFKNLNWVYLVNNLNDVNFTSEDDALLFLNNLIVSKSLESKIEKPMSDLDVDELKNYLSFIKSFANEFQ